MATTQLTAREAINRLYELGFGRVDPNSQFSQAGNLLLKANVEGQAERDGITVIAHKVRVEGLPAGCIGTVVQARYEIREPVDHLNRFGEEE